MGIDDIVKGAVESASVGDAVPEEIMDLARHAAEAVDEKARIDIMATEAKNKVAALREELLKAMKASKIKKITMPDRKPITIKSSSKRDMTLKALTSACETPDEAKTLWDKFPMKSYTYLDIPKQDDDPVV